MAVGVVLAFAWNMTMSQPQAAETGSGVTPQVGLTVEDAAERAWATATPRAAASSSHRFVAVRTSPAGKARGPARRACRVTPRAAPRTPEWTLQVRNISACGQRGRTAGHAPGPFGISS